MLFVQYDEKIEVFHLPMFFQEQTRIKPSLIIKITDPHDYILVNRDGKEASICVIHKDEITVINMQDKRKRIKFIASNPIVCGDYILDIGGNRIDIRTLETSKITEFNLRAISPIANHPNMVITAIDETVVIFDIANDTIVKVLYETDNPDQTFIFSRTGKYAITTSGEFRLLAYYTV